LDGFERLLAYNQPQAKALARDLRRLIRRVLPAAKEKIYLGWGGADHGHGAAGRGFLAIGPQKSYVNLYFLQGKDLNDPQGMLECTGKRLRHVKIKKPADLKSRALEAPVRQAARPNRV
jgi:hypothetical protein